MRLWCQECERPSSPEAKGWRLYRTDVPEEDEEPTLAAYCAVCAYLRHGFASIAASRGIPVNVLSEIMGHSNIGITQQVYIHLFGREQAEQAFREAMSS